MGLLVAPFWVTGASANILGTAVNFAVLGGSTVTNTGSSVVNGDVGISPGTAVTGFPPGIVTPPALIDLTNAAAAQAESDLTAAYNVLAALPFDQSLSGQDLGGLTLTPGVYDFSVAAALTGTLTLNAQGSDNAVWIFQIGSTLTTASSSVVKVINGGPDDGVFWQVGSSATLGGSTVFEGNILANQSITLNGGAIIPCGRALAENGAVTMDTNVVSIACTATTGWDSAQATELGGPDGDLGTGLSNPTPEPGALTLVIAGLIAFLGIALRSSQKKRLALIVP
jgi:type VI secretion system secreted protein VgrG